MRDIAEVIAHGTSQFNESNDCTVRALATVLDGDYGWAWRTMRNLGRKPRRGCNQFVWEKAFNQCGWYLDDVTEIFDARTIRTAERAFAKMPKGTKFVVQVYGHVAAWDGEKIVDWARGRQHRIEKIFHIRRRTGDDLYTILGIERSNDRRSELTLVFSVPGRREGHWKIMILQHGRIRHLNDAWATDYDDDGECHEAEMKGRNASFRHGGAWAGLFGNVDIFEEWVAEQFK